METAASPRTLVVTAVGMAATVYVALWAALALVGPDGLTSPAAATAEVSRQTPAVAAPDLPASPPIVLPASPPIVAGISGLPGGSGALVGQMQRALIRKGYRVGDGNRFDADTVAALQAFQDARALKVQPTCDQQCWSALGLADPK